MRHIHIITFIRPENYCSKYSKRSYENLHATLQESFKIPNFTGLLLADQFYSDLLLAKPASPSKLVLFLIVPNSKRGSNPYRRLLDGFKACARFLGKP